MAELDREPVTIPPEEETSGRNHRTRFVILGVVLALAVGYMVYAAFPGNALYFLTVSEFMGRAEAQDGRMVRVSGVLVNGSFQRVDNSARSQFQLVDREGGREHLAATYVGVLPDLFFNPYSEIILEGRYGPDQVFEANHIMVKCPSKYQALDQEFWLDGYEEAGDLMPGAGS